jgi:imidazolonepropionase-like amidohydrolase
MDNPGFIDAHVHIRGHAGLAQLAAAGIVAARDAGLRGNAAGERRPWCRPQPGPFLVHACWALYKKDGYGSLFGVPVETREEIRDEIHRLKEAGAGIIKVMASGIVSLSMPGSITPGGFTGEELAFIVQESHRVQLDVMAHANGERAIMDSALAGARSVEHGFFMSARALEVMAGQGTFWTPTVGALARAAARSTVPEERKEYAAGLIRAHQDMIVAAQALGVGLAIGTDCTLPCEDYESHYRAEMEYFEHAGLSRDAVLTIARDNGARLLGM